MTKRIITLALAVLTTLSLVVACPVGIAAEDNAVTTLYVYNWGEYISDGSEDSYDSNAEFEAWYEEAFGQKVEVNYSTFSSNEEMYAKISSGSVSYDVIVPSDYMIARMIEEDMLYPLNTDNMENLGSLNENFYNHAHDAENAPKFCYYDKTSTYSVPYFYGMIGVIYNVDMVPEDEENLGSWELMWDEDYTGNILQFNNSRDALGTAQYKLGIDVNTCTEDEWREALGELKRQKPFLQGYVMDEIYNKMENGSAAIAAYYAGDYLTMYESNESLEFFYPSEGTNLYVDAMCIPKTSKNKEIAERYIDFMLSEEAAIANAEYTYYASPNDAVKNNEEYQAYLEDIKEGAFDLMYASTDNAIAYENLTEEKLVLINQLWEELKSDMTVSTPIFVICGVIVATLVGAGVFFAIRRKKRAIY